MVCNHAQSRDAGNLVRMDNHIASARKPRTKKLIMLVSFTSRGLAPETMSHVVSAPEASSPAALVEPAAQSVHTFELT